MTISEIINPRCWSLVMLVGYNNNPTRPRPLYVQDWQWRDEIEKNNPDGRVPILNPEHYINPLSGGYTSGPLDF